MTTEERVFYRIDSDSKWEVLILNGTIKQQRHFKIDEETGNFQKTFSVPSADYTINLSGDELIKFLKAQGYEEKIQTLETK